MEDKPIEKSPVYVKRQGKALAIGSHGSMYYLPLSQLYKVVKGIINYQYVKKGQTIKKKQVKDIEK